jgi:alpha-N-arabinofuranosidase
MAGGFRNPVLPGFFPDPSICRVGDDFYLVNSTFEWFPGLPVHHSRDLVHWRQIGHVINRPGQLDLDGIRPSGGLYAPTIRHHDGRFHVVCTLVDGPSRSGHFLVTATDPAGPWSDPVWLGDAAGFDPSLFFDTDGTAWFCACREPDPVHAPGRTEIYLRELDLPGGRLIGPEHVLWQGAFADATWSEGPHIYRMGGRYHLLTAEGGTARHHAVVVARADLVTGPYVGSPDNPVLTHRHLGRDHPVIGTGHADLVRLADDRWWAALLAMRPYGGGHNLGRETFLAPVSWQDGWPVFAPGAGMVSLDEPVAPDLPAHPWPAVPERDDFDGPGLDLAWTMLRTPRSTWWSLTERPGHLRLRVRPETVADRAQPSFLGRRQQHARFSAATELDFTPRSPRDCAGLVLIQNDDHHLRLVVTGGRLTAIRRQGGVDTELATTALPAGPVRLGVVVDGQDYALRLAGPGEDWRTLVVAVGTVLSSEVAGGFTGAFIGPYASSDGLPSDAVADFAWFDHRGTD